MSNWMHTSNWRTSTSITIALRPRRAREQAVIRDTRVIYRTCRCADERRHLDGQRHVHGGKATRWFLLTKPGLISCLAT